MALLDILKECGVTEEQITNIASKMKEAKVYETTLENADTRYTKLKGQYDSLNTELNTANTTIASLKESAKDSEALTQQIKDYETAIADLKNQSALTAKKFTLEKELAKAGVIDPEYMIYKHGGVEKFAFAEDGRLIGLEDTIKPYREDKTMAHLFKQESHSGYNPTGNKSPVQKNPFAKDSFNLTAQGNLMRSNPALAKQLAAEAGITL